METLLQQQQQQKEKYTSNQEEGFNSMLLRLESPIPTPSPTDQESPIMFSDSCSMCGSKKRRCLTPSCFGQRKKTILIDDPSSMKAAAAAAAADDERSHSRHSSFFHQIPNSSPPPQTSPPYFRRSVSDMSSFALSGSFSSPKSASAVAAIPSNQTSCPSNACFGRSNSFSSCFDSLKKSTISPPPTTTTTTTTLPEISPFSSPKSPENAASTPNRKSNPSNASYFGRSSSFSSCFDSPSSSSPSFHLPKSSSTTATPTDSVQKSDDDQKPIGDQKDQSKDCSSGNCKFVVSAATTTTDHPKHEQIEEGNIKKVQFSCSCGKHYQVQFFG